MLNCLKYSDFWCAVLKIHLLFTITLDIFCYRFIELFEDGRFFFVCFFRKNNSQIPLGRSCLSTVFNVICLSHFLLSAYAQNDDFRRTSSSLALTADHLHLTCLPCLPVKNQSIILIICANVLISYQVPPPLASPASSVFKISFSAWEWYRPSANIYYSHLITSGVATCAKKLTVNILKLLACSKIYLDLFIMVWPHQSNSGGPYWPLQICLQ